MNAFFHVRSMLSPAFFISSALLARGAGFGLNEMSARGNALQGTLVGSTRDVSSVYYNPANLAELDSGRWEFMLGTTFCRPDYDTRAKGVTTDQDESVYPLPHVFLGGGLGDSLYAGFGVYPEYGLGTKYENRRDWPLAADSCKSTLISFTASPEIAWQATDDLALAAGLRVVYLNIVNDRMLPSYGTYFHLDVDDWACSWLAAASYRLTDTLRAGLVYRAETSFEEEGRAEFSDLGRTLGVHGPITMPQSVMAGLNWQATDRLSLGANLTWTGWSSIESLDMRFDTPAVPDQLGPKNWHDTMRYSVGAEYALTDSWKAQVGYSFDEDPTNAGYPDTMCPAGDRDQFGAGLTFARNDWALSFDVMRVHIHPTDRELSGTEVQFRNLRADTLGFSYSRKF